MEANSSLVRLASFWGDGDGDDGEARFLEGSDPGEGKSAKLTSGLDCKYESSSLRRVVCAGVTTSPGL